MRIHKKGQPTEHFFFIFPYRLVYICFLNHIVLTIVVTTVSRVAVAGITVASVSIAGISAVTSVVSGVGSVASVSIAGISAVARVVSGIGSVAGITVSCKVQTFFSNLVHPKFVIIKLSLTYCRNYSVHIRCCNHYCILCCTLDNKNNQFNLFSLSTLKSRFK